MSDNIIGGKYQVIELVAVSWNPEMAQRFPNAEHASCYQEHFEDGGRWRPFDPPRCHDWHCNRCGQPTNSYGHHNCPDRVTP